MIFLGGLRFRLSRILEIKVWKTFPRSKICMVFIGIIVIEIVRLALKVLGHVLMDQKLPLTSVLII